MRATFAIRVLPDKSLLIGQKLAENVKVKKLSCDNFGNFQTLCKDAFWEVKTFKNMTFFDNDKKEKSKRPYLSLETIFQLWTQKIPNFNVSVLFHGV